MNGQMTKADLKKTGDIWASMWNEALSVWSPYTRLREPNLCLTKKDEEREGLTGSFAMIRLNDLAVVISMRMVTEKNLADFPVEIMAHEIGHHVLCPADLTDAAKLTARVRRGLPSRESAAGMVGNLYADLIINDRLFREHGLKMNTVYERASEKTDSPLWNFYMRIYEILWSLDRGSLAAGPVPDEMEGDASLAAELIRSYGRQWLRGAGRFAAICMTYLASQRTGDADNISPWLDAESPGAGSSVPSGLAEIDDDEIAGARHPAFDDPENDLYGGDVYEGKNGGGQSGKSYREPSEFGEILRSLGIVVERDEIAARYYKERALPYIVPFPSAEVPRAEDPLPEGSEVWDSASPVDEIDWIESASRSPVIIPGITALKRVYGASEGSEPAREPLDLDIYVDCSGSMPDPAESTSYPCLAGVIICLSALRAGARVQATLWSGPDEVITTNGFIASEKKIMGVLTGYLGGSTAFPLHILRDTFAKRKPTDRKAHILIISDDGIDTIFANDEKNRPGEDIINEVLPKAGGGATMALNLYQDWKKYKPIVRASKLGFEINRVAEMSGLIEFSRTFSRKRYGGEKI